MNGICKTITISIIWLSIPLIAKVLDNDANVSSVVAGMAFFATFTTIFLSLIFNDE